MPREEKNCAFLVSQPGIGLVCIKGIFLTAASVLVSALLAPLLTSWVVKRYGDARTAQQRQPKKEAAK